MRFIGFNFSKISVEKFLDKIENLKIDTKIDVSEINTIKSSFFKTKEEIIGIKFNYAVNYNPDFAKIEFIGTVIFAVESKMAKNILSQWENKQMSEDFKIKLFNIILRKSNLKALELEDELNLPLHIPLPTVKSQEKEEDKQN
ncbi:hypothetical protein KAR52_03640 [Candidatus Pacearchaeota archaeon]|nr:hypothetical protein [Candidatus Pacearchaeota archaeon]